MAVEKIIIEPANNGFIASNGKGVKLIGKTTKELTSLIAEQTAKAVNDLSFANSTVELTISVETVVTPQNSKNNEQVV